VGHAAYLRERKGACSVSVGKLRERDQLKDLVVDGQIMLK
jgi:hypothetical protein